MLVQIFSPKKYRSNNKKNRNKELSPVIDESNYLSDN